MTYNQVLAQIQEQFGSVWNRCVVNGQVDIDRMIAELPICELRNKLKAFRFGTLSTNVQSR